MRFEIESSIH